MRVSKVTILLLLNVSVYIVDHILLMFLDAAENGEHDEPIKSFNINKSEVKEIKFVKISDLKYLDSSTLTPWFQKILSTDLLSTWINGIHAIDDCDKDDIVKTKFSDNKINL